MKKQSISSFVSFDEREKKIVFRFRIKYNLQNESYNIYCLLNWPFIDWLVTLLFFIKYNCVAYDKYIENGIVINNKYLLKQQS